MKNLNLRVDYNTFSHELLIPLSGILGMAEILSGEKLSETQLEQLKIIQDAGNRLLNFINRILNSPIEKRLRSKASYKQH